MATRRLAWGILTLGVIFLTVQSYWWLYPDIGFSTWFFSLPIIWGHQYYLAIGGMYVLSGLLALKVSGEDNRDFRQLSLGVGAILLVVWIGLVVYQWNTATDIVIWQVAFQFGTGPVMVAFLIGASADPAITGRLWWVVVLMMLPLVAIVGASGVGLEQLTLTDVVLLTSIMHLVIFDLIWSYPMYRLGNSLG